MILADTMKGELLFTELSLENASISKSEFSLGVLHKFV
jgi:hypothetical protein